MSAVWLSALPRSCRSFAGTQLRRQRGASMIVCLLMLLVVLMLGTSATQIALQGEKASRNDRDRQFALEAAEAALRDAELDIERSSRGHLFTQKNVQGFVAGCGDGTVNLNLGLCLHAAHDAVPVWLDVDMASAEGQKRSVPIGHFTGRAFQTGHGLLPALPPRYIIELISYVPDTSQASSASLIYLYRITALGFGLRETTQVVLQTFYRKIGDPDISPDMPKGRLSWREISNWRELHNVLSDV